MYKCISMHIPPFGWWLSPKQMSLLNQVSYIWFKKHHSPTTIDPKWRFQCQVSMAFRSSWSSSDSMAVWQSREIPRVLLGKKHGETTWEIMENHMFFIVYLRKTWGNRKTSGNLWETKIGNHMGFLRRNHDMKVISGHIFGI